MKLFPKISCYDFAIKVVSGRFEKTFPWCLKIIFINFLNLASSSKYAPVLMKQCFHASLKDF